MEIKWKSVEELPMEEPLHKKILILAEGKSDEEDKLEVYSDYWCVFLNGNDVKFYTYKKKKLGDKMFSYGYLRELRKKIPFEKIKGWMFTDELIKLYNE